MSTAWMVSSGAYSDYQVLVVTLTHEEAQRWADAYNAERQSLYRDDAEVEEIDLYRDGDPLPQRVSYWNADNATEWEITDTVWGSAELVPQVIVGGPRGALARCYPTREAARAAVDEALGATS